MPPILNSRTFLISVTLRNRIEFRLAGPDPRIALRRRSRISPAQRAEIDARLKELGLTESLEVGYRLSPRGRAYYYG